LDDSSVIVQAFEAQNEVYTSYYRINYDGVQDMSFGINGQVQSADSLSFVSYVMKQYDADRFVSFGGNYYTNNDTFTCSLFRYYTNGQIDTTFGDHGVAQFPIVEDLEYATGVHVLEDKKILVSFKVTDEYIGLRRFLPDGSLDYDFGDVGLVEWNLPAGFEGFSPIEIKVKSEKIYLMGIIDNSTGMDGIAVLRLNANGTIDTNFGVDGLVNQPMSNLDLFGIDNCHILDDGSLHFSVTVIGQSSDNNVIKTIQLTPDGSLDDSYGDNGVSVIPFPLGSEFSTITSSIIQPDGKIVLVGSLDSEWPFVCRLNKNGTLDHSLGTNGFSYWVSPDYEEGANLNGALMKDNSLWGLGYITDSDTDELFGLITKYKSGLVSGTNTPKKLIPMDVFPNPIKDNFQVQFDLENGGEVAIELMSLSGKKVASFGKSWLASGVHTANYTLPANLASGSYLLTLRKGTQVSSIAVVIDH